MHDTETASNNRNIGWIDLARGVGIILVIVSHCIAARTLLVKTIFAFHMPLFFILSGLCHRMQGCLTFTRKRFLRLMIPFAAFFAFGLVATLLIPAWRDAFTLDKLKADLYLLRPENVHNSSIWFLPCLFTASIVFNAALRLFREKRMAIVISAVLALLAGCILSAKIPFEPLPYGRFPGVLDVAVPAYGFYAFGWLMKDPLIKARERMRLPVKLCCMLLFAAALMVCARLNGDVNLYPIKFCNPMLFLTASFSGSLMIIFFCQVLEEKGGQLIRKILTFYGRNSLYILGTQSVLIRILILVCNRCFGTAYELYYMDAPYSIIVLLVTTVIAEPILCLAIGRVKKRLGKDRQRLKIPSL